MRGFRTGSSHGSSSPLPVEGQSAKPVAGQMAPEFKLVDQNGKTHTLADYKGKWVVVYFYPKDQTPGCTSQACSFTENVFAFRKAGAQILGISVDDETSHKAFEKALSTNSKISAENQKDIQEHGLPFPLLADPTMDTGEEVRRAGEAWQRHHGFAQHLPGRSHRQSGQVLRREHGEARRHGTHSAEVLADIAAFKAAPKKG